MPVLVRHARSKSSVGMKYDFLLTSLTVPYLRIAERIAVRRIGTHCKASWWPVDMIKQEDVRKAVTSRGEHHIVIARNSPPSTDFRGNG